LAGSAKKKKGINIKGAGPLVNIEIGSSCCCVNIFARILSIWAVRWSRARGPFDRLLPIVLGHLRFSPLTTSVFCLRLCYARLSRVSFFPELDRAIDLDFVFGLYRKQMLRIGNYGNF